MSKYLEFKQVPFKGKTKRFEIISKTSYLKCDCEVMVYNVFLGYNKECKKCKGTGKLPLILGRISWYGTWRQYTFSPSFETIWNKDCLKDIQDFLQQLMDERKKKLYNKVFDETLKYFKGIKE